MKLLIIQESEGYDDLVMSESQIADIIESAWNSNNWFGYQIDVEAQVIQADSVIVVRDAVNQATYEDETKVQVFQL